MYFKLVQNNKIVAICRDDFLRSGAVYKQMSEEGNIEIKPYLPKLGEHLVIDGKVWERIF